MIILVSLFWISWSYFIVLFLFLFFLVKEKFIWFLLFYDEFCTLFILFRSGFRFIFSVLRKCVSSSYLFLMFFVFLHNSGLLTFLGTFFLFPTTGKVCHRSFFVVANHTRNFLGLFGNRHVIILTCLARQLVRQPIYTMFISNNGASFHLWWKENLVKTSKSLKILWKRL